MAIFNPRNPAAPAQVAGGVQFRLPANQSPVLQSANNNFNSPSPGFQQMDQLIRSLDAQYSMLSNKAPWEDYAIFLDGQWELCANCDPDEDAQRLYRQYNYNRVMQSVPVTLVPIDGSEVQSQAITDLQYYPNANAGLPLALYDLATTSPGVGATAVISAAWQNPFQFLSDTNNGVVLFPTDAEFPFVQAVARAVVPNPPVGTTRSSVKLCTWAPNGTPGLSAIVELVVIVL